MRIGIVTVGSRGDVEPFVGLAHRLRQAGHTVTVSAPGDAAHLVAGAEVPFVPIDIDMHRVHKSPEGQKWITSGNSRAFLRGSAQVLSQARETLGDCTMKLAVESDLLVAGIQTDDYAVAAGELLGIPVIAGYFSPWTETGDFPNLLVSTGRIRATWPGRPLHRASHRLTELAYWNGKRHDINAFRARIGLGPVRMSAVGMTTRTGLPVLHAYSRHLMSRPADWAENQVMTGFWRLPREVHERVGERTPPEGLTEWLGVGDPPFFVTFGSMPILDPDVLLTRVVEAAKRTGRRILLGAGWTEVNQSAALPENVRVIGATDHSWLLPQCRGAISHGGAGTTAAALHAGIPTWAFALFADQPFWGNRLTERGIGGFNRFLELNADTLSAAIRRLDQSAMQSAARAFGERLRSEDGLGAAVGAIHRTAETSVARRPTSHGAASA
ncbi:glycosyltransferase [Micromonospora mirobrigensis]|uniref:Sterol 3beta-glucosyltransferase n=1 Tax=Micromonospora mirobrigensis TaxID=262898 RepID=A0A1C5AK69_9ACTN|nr:glycosyltransferase [Micromonospora mirobrigensis]SCF45471.1 sterol 3beta-glucosyltransferase [Micromonospora mirobrigensis]